MAENIEAKVVDGEELSIAEKEQLVQEKAGVAQQEDGVYKVNLANPPKEQTKEEDNAVQEQSTESSVLGSSDTSKESGQEAEVELQEVGEGNEETIEEVILEEVTDEENTTEDIQEEAPTAEEVVEAIEESQQTGVDLPENIQKVVDFINETGGTLEDYVALNKDYSTVEDMALLRDYYKQNKPHLSAEEIDFLIEDSFSFDEDVDDEREIKRKKLRFKEEVANARKSLESLKSQYYEEIKGGSRLTPEQQKAVEFFNRYNKENEESSKIVEKQKSVFLEKTDKVFNNEFKGFEYKVGDKRYRFNVKNKDEVKSTQSDINNFIRKFLNDDQTMNDAAGYHKSLFTAMNADAIANHFYEQGKADALKTSMQTAKNIDMDPRGMHNKTVDVGGMKAKVISGEDTSNIKIKLKNY